MPAWHVVNGRGRESLAAGPHLPFSRAAPQRKVLIGQQAHGVDRRPAEINEGALHIPLRPGRVLHYAVAGDAVLPVRLDEVLPGVTLQPDVLIQYKHIGGKCLDAGIDRAGEISPFVKGYEQQARPN